MVRALELEGGEEGTEKSWGVRGLEGEETTLALETVRELSLQAKAALQRLQAARYCDQAAAVLQWCGLQEQQQPGPAVPDRRGLQNPPGNLTLPPVTGGNCVLQVCYLPTNQCKDRLSFSLLERTACTNSSDCSKHEVSPALSSTQLCIVNSNATALLKLYSGFVMAGVLLS